ncbi:Zn-ribbon domain-containing OB-fold protein [Nocardia sp. CA-084685]|uniref:Zn-ribbon domain-containing OB-fold protein n=1 Tax=Nocardia sp. CA-084685 TaxID=3239970 RepID=UPI003D9912E6
MSSNVPIVNYLVLDGNRAYLQTTECRSCKATFFGSRIACARCGETEFDTHPAADTGNIRCFSIIHRAVGGIRTPFVSGIVTLDCGSVVKTNIIGCLPDTDHVALGMRVRMQTYAVGTDDNGTTAVAFGFTPTTASEQS